MRLYHFVALGSWVTIIATIRPNSLSLVGLEHLRPSGTRGLDHHYSTVVPQVFERVGKL